MSATLQQSMSPIAWSMLQDCSPKATGTPANALPLSISAKNRDVSRIRMLLTLRTDRLPVKMTWASYKGRSHRLRAQNRCQAVFKFVLWQPKELLNDVITMNGTRRSLISLSEKTSSCARLMNRARRTLSVENCRYPPRERGGLVRGPTRS